MKGKIAQFFEDKANKNFSRVCKQNITEFQSAIFFLL